MNQFALFLVLGISLLFVSLVIANEGLPNSCGNDTRLCPDGTILSRDPSLNCSFPSCPYSNLFHYCTPGVISVKYYNNISLIVYNNSFVVYTPSKVYSCRADCPNYNWSVTINCSLVDKRLAYKCPKDYYEFEGFKLINCSLNPSYCDAQQMQWIKYNCGIEFAK